ncbi:MAG: hypothetical protein A2847_02880 [Candidatus Sungbacteria bacterium RIFCSPHIGHO2_01_FULL_50_25]|uniref:Uncharacterized protein n=1 Tax=Candidatus Sungbacteria bacterium RIFCSPHIGHO2_01_FULL_50_25 TaxID=1802265 RepID=A0A1G2KA54_9BACT|nr:MAG: hypothetical protein A2847_02880 [Candidatus Sungbacteria bacterium RIFCSPHIGHO2_01_FULL_50_25]
MEQPPQQEQHKEKRYWNTRYCETIEEAQLPRCGNDYLKDTIYVGEFSDEEWKKFIRSAPRGYDDDPIINGAPVIKKEGIE